MRMTSHPFSPESTFGYPRRTWEEGYLGFLLEDFTVYLPGSCLLLSFMPYAPAHRLVLCSCSVSWFFPQINRVRAGEWT
ncbi:hypothetical protein CRENBAI_004710 [Crenichthys baileyi]|uniref:Uncharacterized protein n=1 Tax=Crenichthys baileyi TaxID=28760 RepID=A0AAV9R7U7_9TELE